MESTQHRTRYGTTNPEFVQSELWSIAISNNWAGYHFRKYLSEKFGGGNACQDFSLSTYRESLPGPFWSWERFGRTSTAMPDGRVIHIAGEHEDAYDPDFCIYNDVVVEYPGGAREFYLYPKHIFPPTDFHSATLVGDDLILIGSLGYKDMRRPGVTQVLKLNTRTLAIASVVTSGEGPGWISRHHAERIGDDKILVAGGKLATSEGYIDNLTIFELDTRSMRWSRRDNGDVSIFPVGVEDYTRFKSPDYGVSNPEKVTNPFWLAMAKFGWPPSRARLHFADFAPAKPEPRVGNASVFDADVPLREPGTKAFEDFVAKLDISLPKLTRHREDVVWTTQRRDAGRVTLTDGRKLLIGGRVEDYGDEYADPWTYNDIVVTDPNGNVVVFAYPLPIFPQLWSWIPVPHDNSLLIFGLADGELHPERSDRLVVLRLDTSSFEITPLPVRSPNGFRLNVYPGCGVRRGDQVVFPNVRLTNDDPALGIALDLDSMTWSEPFMHECPPSTEDD